MNAILVVIIASSLAFQVFAAIMALRLIRVTGNRVSWILIASASILQAVRRAIPLYHSIAEDTTVEIDPLNETIGLVLSILMVAGITTIGPFFTSIKRSEEALVRLNAELERRVEERTKALKGVQDKMVRQEKLAAIGKLAGSIGHELRNPLGVITNSAYFLSMKLPASDEKITKHLKIIQEEALRSNKIISDLLDFARTKPDEACLVNIPEQIIETLKHVTRPENIDVTTNFGDNLPKLLVDPRKIQQAFQNLIVNGFQAMPTGGILAITVMQNKDTMEIDFKDTGIGIPVENLPNLFEPLFSTKISGIGLGLPITKEIVEGYRGKIEVESVVHSGSTFTIKIPVTRT